jgi:hypothetical protein
MFSIYKSELSLNLSDDCAIYCLNTVKCLLKYCPLYGNGSIMKRAIVRQRPATTTEELLGAMFSMLSVPRHYSKSRRGNLVSEVARLPES